MVSPELLILIATAASVGFLHTIFGPDHYVPFIAMAKAGGWSKSKTALVTFFSGLAHVLSSVVLGVFGLSFGIAVAKLEYIESFRGDLAGWALLTFGLVYFVWGMRKIFKNENKQQSQKTNLLPWVIFTIFIFGPCEPLIPILMYPAAKGNLWNAVWGTAVFGGVTIATMMTVVMAGSFGFGMLPVGRLQRFGHAFAGAAICLCGAAIQLLG